MVHRVGTDLRLVITKLNLQSPLHNTILSARQLQRNELYLVYSNAYYSRLNDSFVRVASTMEVVHTATLSATPVAPSRACVTCARAKAKCVPGPEPDSKCSRY